MKPPALLLLLLGFAACGRQAPAGKAPAAGAQPAVLASLPGDGIELRRGQEPRELVRIGLRSVVIGAEGGPLAWKVFSEPRRTDDAWYFLRTYAPFEVKSAEGDLTFHGHGKVKPGPAERRMILEWARQVATEAADGRGSAAYGLVLAWHQGGPAGLCEDLVLYLTGEAVATSCGWDREVQGRLDSAPLGRVYGWFDRLQAFQTGGSEPEESLQTGKLQARVIFAGRGVRSPTAANQEEIQSFAAALFAELAARRRGFVAPEAPGTPAAPPTHLLLPPGAGPGPEEIVLELPEKPPPPPSPHPLTPSPGPPPAPAGERGNMSRNVLFFFLLSPAGGRRAGRGGSGR